MQIGGAPVLVVTGLLAEAQIAMGPGTAVVCRGRREERLQDLVRSAANGRFGAVVSFGVAGGLDPALSPGRIVIAQQIIRGSQRLTADAALARRLQSRLSPSIADVVMGDIAAAEESLCRPEDKSVLRQMTGASVVDMESWGAALLAAELGVGFAAVRAICDPAHRRVPAAALSGLGADGSVSAWNVICSLINAPSELPDLAYCAAEWVRALRALRRARAALGSGFGLSDL